MRSPPASRIRSTWRICEEGNDVGGIDVGFLVKTGEVAAGIARVQVIDVTQQGKEATWTEPNGTASLLNDRPPLVLDARGAFRRRTHLPVHRHRRAPALAQRRRQRPGRTARPRWATACASKRQKQADFLATLIQHLQADRSGPAHRDPGRLQRVRVQRRPGRHHERVTGPPTPDGETAVPGDGIDLVNPTCVNLGVLEPAETNAIPSSSAAMRSRSTMCW